jgi:hypothetical protein
MSKNGNRGAKFARACELRDESVYLLSAGTHNRKARRLLAMQLRRKSKKPAEPAK